MREELKIIFTDKNNSFSEFLRDEESLLQLAFLSDMFSHLNDLNTRLRGHNKNILIMTDKVNAFIKKVGIWTIRFDKRIYCNFWIY